MEEYCGVIEQIRISNTQCLDQLVDTFPAKWAQLVQLFTMIDRLETIVDQVDDSVQSMEHEVDRAEEMVRKRMSSTTGSTTTASSSRVRKLFKFISDTSAAAIGPAVAGFSASTSSGDLQTSANGYKFERPKIFKTSELLFQGKDE